MTTGAAAANSDRPSWPKLATLLALYFAQGLPFGFQATALPLLLREQGASLQTIGFSGLLAAPWLAKALWAPLVDRYGSTRFGRRKSWIVPMQLALAACGLIAAQTDDLALIAALVLAMNFFAATQDIAVDALALSWLPPAELGPANALQVIGYKLGMLTGGGLLVWASAWIGWSGLFYCIAGLMLMVALVSLRLREAGSEPGPGAPELTPAFSEIAVRLRSAARHPAAAALILVVVTYKLGESLADPMWKPMLFDRGFTTSQIGLWNGTFGMTCSLLGSLFAGLLVRRVALADALIWTAALRAAGVGAEWWFSTLPAPVPAQVIGVTCLAHLTTGAITTVVFALMMRHTDRAIGGTHYTLLASLEVWGKLPASAISGVVAAALGYPTLFAIGSVLCAGFALACVRLRDRLAEQS